jgi:hypothetical protein
MDHIAIHIDKPDLVGKIAGMKREARRRFRPIVIGHTMFLNEHLELRRKYRVNFKAFWSKHGQRQAWLKSSPSAAADFDPILDEAASEAIRKANG